MSTADYAIRFEKLGDIAPVAFGTTTAGTSTQTLAVGKNYFRRVNDLVQFNIDLNVSNLAGSAGNLRINLAGLPVSKLVNKVYYPKVVSLSLLDSDDTALTPAPTGVVVGTLTQIEKVMYLDLADNAGAIASSTAATANDGIHLVMSGEYRV